MSQHVYRVGSRLLSAPSSIPATRATAAALSSLLSARQHSASHCSLYRPQRQLTRRISSRNQRIDRRQCPATNARYSTATTQQQPYRKTFDKLLIANRGEIACRIIKTAHKMGVRTVAVYSELDANARHVQLADEAVCLGDAQSYLSIPRILDAVRRTGAQAVHPGYGFLSENPAFVKALEDANITFVGPSADAIAAMGDKIQSKLIAHASGVHCIPGYDGEVESVQVALDVAHEIGYPVMIKASAGGGGKGMRIAWDDDQLKEGFKLAKQESKSAFDDDRMLIEKYIDQPHHIEIQVLGDKHGNVVYLPERECSIQRRNQKVIEESPSVHVDAETRRKMGEEAVALARHVKYNSAGTVEFLVDANRNFYFLEMNTRLQVEHPITEYVTGLDLVEQMLYSAAGYPLSIQQKDIQCHGWAIESRVYAEDPTKYLPSIGRLLVYQEPPQISDHVRCDSGINEGTDIAVDYDPLLCKLTTHGNTRDEAIDSMVHALDEYVIKGVTHNIPLLRSVVDHPRFRAGKAITTNFLAEEYPDGYRTASLSDIELEHLAAVNAGMWAKKEASMGDMADRWQVWVQVTDEQSGHMRETKLDIARNGVDDFKVSSPNLKNFAFSTRWPLKGLLAKASMKETGQELVVQYLDELDFGCRIQYRGDKFKVVVMSDRQHELAKYMKQKQIEQVSDRVISPMPGRIISVAVQKGDKVIQGAEVAVVEAMKMQNVLRTTRDGTVKNVHVQQGNPVKAGQVLIEFFEDDE
ncbi:carbamoyl-phosphate synthase L chain, ATP binding domain-containing protein [Zychaea mexicana]|uniref:carbamoyl-phosphate synthase L chain, ATP binding domain-containing protein n=1 Tax=Zychaea mexicana TaxID=64656 RepID=UPI0022FE0B99|nr:carbamoyl-phosphate synthase L chain, ATP binding domain-containing protein [Zychaea mexicana]KAI9489233.1 carbamoyl-phosphate synthase L chain, ATP binding domain-containing protein [Zychaea mexicana]